jgi:hypothetical protein
MRTSATSAIMELQTRLRLMRYYCTSVGHTTYAPLVSPIDPRFPVEDVLFQTSPFKDPSGKSASGKDYARNALLYLETCILPAPSRAPFHYRISLQAKDMEPTGSHSKRHLIRYLTRRLLPPLPCFFMMPTFCPTLASKSALSSRRNSFSNPFREVFSASRPTSQRGQAV